MIIAMIKGASRVCGKAQGYLGLPIRDMMIVDKTTGRAVPAMETAWTPTPDELERLNKGANIIVRILGEVPPPMMIEVDTELPEQLPKTDRLRTTVETILANFEKSELVGYRSRDRQYAITMLRHALRGD